MNKMAFGLFLLLVSLLTGIVGFSMSATQICNLYDNNVHLYHVLATVNEIQQVNLCHNESTNSKVNINVDSKAIKSFEIDYWKQNLWYLTEDYRLYVLSLQDFKPNEQPALDFAYLKPSKIALDWINELLFMASKTGDIYAVDSGNVYSSSVVNLYSFSSVEITKLAVCPRLSLLVWSEVDWLGENVNRIRLGIEDGTEHGIIYQSHSFIYDLQLDQINLALYFVTNSHVGQISLYSLSHLRSLYLNIQNTPVTYSAKTFQMSKFSLLYPYFAHINSHKLILQNLEFSESQSHVGSSEDQIVFTLSNEFAFRFSSFDQTKLVHSRWQPKTERACPEKRYCEDLCLPNGHVSRFTCLCQHYNPPCSTYGHYDHVPELASKVVETTATASEIGHQETSTLHLADIVDSDFEEENVFSSSHQLDEKSHSSTPIITFNVTTIDTTESDLILDQPINSTNHSRSAWSQLILYGWYRFSNNNNTTTTLQSLFQMEQWLYHYRMPLLAITVVVIVVAVIMFVTISRLLSRRIVKIAKMDSVSSNGNAIRKKRPISILAFSRRQNSYIKDSSYVEEEPNSCLLSDPLDSISQPNHWTLLKNFPCLEPIPFVEPKHESLAMNLQTYDNWEYQNVPLSLESSFCSNFADTSMNSKSIYL